MIVITYTTILFFHFVNGWDVAIRRHWFNRVIVALLVASGCLRQASPTRTEPKGERPSVKVPCGFIAPIICWYRLFCTFTIRNGQPIYNLTICRTYNLTVVKNKFSITNLSITQYQLHLRRFVIVAFYLLLFVIEQDIGRMIDIGSAWNNTKKWKKKKKKLIIFHLSY